MGIKIQTIRDISNYLSAELSGLYPEEEIRAIANIVASSVFGITKLHQLYISDLIITENNIREIVRIGNELKTGKPLQYVLGETTFYGCRIKLNSSTLIPRQETEELVDLIIRENRGFNGKIIDFCTGSGCIAIPLALNIADAEIIATDISEDALRAARENAALNHAEVKFIRDDILNSSSGEIGSAGIIVCNPPYVRNSEKELMHENVLNFEPWSALFVDDADPLIYYRAVLRLTEKICNQGAKLYFEINEALGNEMISLMESYGFDGSIILKDLNGRERIAKGVKHGRK
jgi:release factor glutamine methyltransferase